MNPEQRCKNCWHWGTSTWDDLPTCDAIRASDDPADGQMIALDRATEAAFTPPAEFGCTLWESK